MHASRGRGCRHPLLWLWGLIGCGSYRTCLVLEMHADSATGLVWFRVSVQPGQRGDDD
jgi:hypothetical protein